MTVRFPGLHLQNYLKKEVGAVATVRTKSRGQLVDHDMQIKIGSRFEGVATSVYITQRTRAEETGTMVGKGHAMVVVRPGTLQETMKVLEACLNAEVAILPQGAPDPLCLCTHGLEHLRWVE